MVSRAAGALGEAKHLLDVSCGVASIQSVVAEAAPGMVVRRVVGAVELVLDAEVVELVQHVVGPVRLVPELPEQLSQGRVFLSPVLKCLACERLRVEGNFILSF